MALPQFTMSELLGAGVHFGHRSFRWNPKLKSYIYGTRNGIHIFDLTQTVPMMYTALAAIEATVARGGRVLFVGTKKQAQAIAKEAADRSGMYYVNHRWLGGILTNWKTVSQSIKRLKEIEKATQERVTGSAPVPTEAPKDIDWTSMYGVYATPSGFNQAARLWMAQGRLSELGNGSLADFKPERS